MLPIDLTVTHNSFMGDSLLKTSNSQEEPKEEVYSFPIPEVDLFREITRNYARQLGVLPTVPLLPW